MGAGGVLTIVGASEIAGGDIRVTYRGGHSTVYGTSTFFTVVTQ